jgi:fibronectin-binding autotransporter adhesin
LQSGVLQASGAVSLANPITLGVAAGTNPVVLAGPLTFGGAVTLANTTTVLTAGQSTFNGAVGGAFGLTLAGFPIVTQIGTLTTGAGSFLVLNAVNGYTGATTINGGTLVLGVRETTE